MLITNSKTLDILSAIISDIEKNDQQIARIYDEAAGTLISNIYAVFEDLSRGNHDKLSEYDKKELKYVLYACLEYEKNKNVISVIKSVSKMLSAGSIDTIQLDCYFEDTDDSYLEVIEKLHNKNSLDSNSLGDENDVEIESHDFDFESISLQLNMLFEDIIDLYRRDIITGDGLSYIVTHLLFMFYNRVSSIRSELRVEALKNISKAVSQKIERFYHKFIAEYMRNLNIDYDNASKMAQQTINRVLSSQNNHNRSIERSCWASIRVTVAQISSKYMSERKIKLYQSVNGYTRKALRDRIKHIILESNKC